MEARGRADADISFCQRGREREGEREQMRILHWLDRPAVTHNASNDWANEGGGVGGEPRVVAVMWAADDEEQSQ